MLVFVSSKHLVLFIRYYTYLFLSSNMAPSLSSSWCLSESDIARYNYVLLP